MITLTPVNSPVLSVCLSVCPVSLCPISLSRGCSGVSKVAGDDAVSRKKIHVYIQLEHSAMERVIGGRGNEIYGHNYFLQPIRQSNICWGEKFLTLIT